MKYFDNIYVNITKQEFDEISESVYLKDLYNKKTDIDFHFIRSQILDLKNITKSIQTYKNIHNLIIEYPSTDLIDSNKQYDIVMKFLKQINNEIDLYRGDLEKSNKLVFDKMIAIVSDIEVGIKPKYYSSLIDDVNKNIHNFLTEKNVKLEIDNNQYIQYFLENSHVLLNSSDDSKRQYSDIIKTVTRYIIWILNFEIDSEDIIEKRY